MGWAILSNLDGVTEIIGGPFLSELDAVERQIYHLEVQRAEIADKIATAKRRRHTLRRKT